MSAFEKHADEIKTYEAASGTERGRLLFAMAILSDCQEMVGKGDISDELNEAKELNASVIELLTKSELSDLYLVRFEIRDGEHEYLSEDFAKGASLEEAEKVARDFLKTYYGEDTELVDETQPEGWVQDAMGYPAARLRTVEKVNNVTDIVNRIGTIN